MGPVCGASMKERISWPRHCVDRAWRQRLPALASTSRSSCHRIAPVALTHRCPYWYGRDGDEEGELP